MKKTILSPKQTELLESLLAKYGQIVTSDQIYAQAQSEEAQRQLKKLVTRLVKTGWLIRVRRGLYAISDFSNRGFLSLSPYVVANLLVPQSYVSFESALAYRGMFDQLTDKIISIARFQYKTVQLNSVEYSFVASKEELFLGWEKVTIENQSACIATAEKALIDMVQFHRSKYTVDLVIEKIRDYESSLDMNSFNDYLSNMSLVTIKVFGFILDLLGIDSTHLQSLIKGKQTANLMLTGDKKFNAKWRLYYDEYFDKYQKS